MSREKKSKRKNVSSVKGKVLEMIVAGMHESPDVKIERNIKIPTIRNKKRKREIDILMVGKINGYPIRMAIECKNYDSIINVPFIDGFIGKLQDIGIPTQQGIFITSKGFSEGAKSRAEEVGITPLVLTGLTSDGLSEKIIDATQSIIYLLAEITNISITCDLSGTHNFKEMWFLYDENGKLKATIPDLFWREWALDNISTKLGESQIEINNSNNLNLIIDGKQAKFISACAKIKVSALVLDIKGKGTDHLLINPIENNVNRISAEVKYKLSPDIYPIRAFDNEKDLENYINSRPQDIKLTIGRIKLPRIRYYYLYWPISSRALIEFETVNIKCKEEGREISDEELNNIEGHDLRTMFDTVAEDNPIVNEVREIIINILKNNSAQPANRADLAFG
jgi:hypothetical protein